MDAALIFRLAAGSDEALAEFRQLLYDRDPEATALYRQHQERSLGPEPLADRAFEWPAELDNPTTILDVPRSEPIHAWRMWALQGSYLVAPLMAGSRGLTRKTPGMAWRKGVNTASVKWCGGATGKHPLLGHCACGIRGVQSRTVLAAFVDAMEGQLVETRKTLQDDRRGVAVAQIACWAASRATATTTTGGSRSAPSTPRSSGRSRWLPSTSSTAPPWSGATRSRR